MIKNIIFVMMFLISLVISSCSTEAEQAELNSMVENALQTPNAYMEVNPTRTPAPLTDEFDHYVVDETIVLPHSLWFCVDAETIPVDGDFIYGENDGTSDINCFRRDHSEDPLLYRGVSWRWEEAGI